MLNDNLGTLEALERFQPIDLGVTVIGVGDERREDFATPQGLESRFPSLSWSKGGSVV